MNIIILGVRIIEDSDNRGSDNRGCTVTTYRTIFLWIGSKSGLIHYGNYILYMQSGLRHF